MFRKNKKGRIHKNNTLKRIKKARSYSTKELLSIEIKAKNSSMNNSSNLKNKTQNLN